MSTLLFKTSVLIAIALFGAGCSRNLGPSYPSDWPPLSSNTGRSSAEHDCPDLSGTYVLPAKAAAPLRGARRKGEFEFVHYFLSVNSQRGWLGMPTKLKLEGPSQGELRVTFYRSSGAVTVEGTLRLGQDFICRGKWITEVVRNQPETYMTTSHARDSEGRLIGFRGNASAYAGVFHILGIPIPLAGISTDKVWWRIESMPADQMK
jgi:hypothetical protein